MQVEVVERWSWNVYMFAISLEYPVKQKKYIAKMEEAIAYVSIRKENV